MNQISENRQFSDVGTSSIRYSIPLDDGNVLLIEDNGIAAIFNPDTGIFRSISNMNRKRVNHFSALKLLDGRVLVWGGNEADTTGTPLMDAEIFDPKTETFKLIDFKIPLGKSLVVLKDGNVLITGGSAIRYNPPWGGYSVPVNQAYVYDPKKEILFKIANMKRKRTRSQSFLLDNGNVLIVGGPVEERAELFIPQK